MFIYKITNSINGKVYIGQSKRPIQNRFNRHINDAMNNILDTHFARAIRKYGSENFLIEQIDTSNNQIELNLKEQFWIKHYDSVNIGYNETDAIYKCGGNTYQSKTKSEKQEIGLKISKTKIGINNPNAKKIKCLNTETNEELIFSTVLDCQQFFNEKTHRFISTRTNNQTKSLYKGIWNIAYFDDDYKECIIKVDKKGTQLLVENIIDNTTEIYKSIRKCSRETGINRSILQLKIKDNNIFIINNYKITILN